MPSRHGPKVDRFYHSAEWKRCRAAFIAYKKGVCEVCGRRGYLVHHRIELDESNVDDPDISLNFDNLELLCTTCHNVIHGDMDHGRADKPTVCVFGDDGKVQVFGREERKNGKPNRQAGGSKEA